MLSNLITLAVDDDNDGGITPAIEHIYSRFDEYQNRSEYIHTNHTVATRDKLGFYRTFPKANGNFRGAQKCAVKLTKDYSVSGVDTETTLVRPAIGEIGFSIPVGLTPAQTLEFRMRLVAVILDDAIMVPLMDQLMI